MIADPVKALLYVIIPQLHGLHTAHHEHSRAHWADLTQLHRDRYRHRVDPALDEAGLLPYMARVYVLGALSARYRSRSLIPSDLPTSPPSATRQTVS